MGASGGEEGGLSGLLNSADVDLEELAAADAALPWTSVSAKERTAQDGVGVLLRRPEIRGATGMPLEPSRP